MKIVGQNNIIEKFKIISSLYKNKKITDIPSTLFISPPGYGKTTLSNYCISMFDKDILKIQGPLLKNKSDLFNLLARKKDNEIIFIDEIHAISKNVQEMIFSLLDFSKVEISVGSGIDQESFTFEYEDFSLFGATTNPELLTNAFESRFSIIELLEEYDNISLIEIFNNYILGKNLELSIDIEIEKEFISTTNRTPRDVLIKSNKLIWFLMSINENNLSKGNMNQFKKFLGYDSRGINIEEENYLNFLASGSKSIELISHYMSKSKSYIQSRIEINLIRSDLIKISSRGRELTDKGKKLIKLV